MSKSTHDPLLAEQLRLQDSVPTGSLESSNLRKLSKSQKKQLEVVISLCPQFSQLEAYDFCLKYDFNEKRLEEAVANLFEDSRHIDEAVWQDVPLKKKDNKDDDTNITTSNRGRGGKRGRGESSFRGRRGSNTNENKSTETPNETTNEVSSFPVRGRGRGGAFRGATRGGGRGGRVESHYESKENTVPVPAPVPTMSFADIIKAKKQPVKAEPVPVVVDNSAQEALQRAQEEQLLQLQIQQQEAELKLQRENEALLLAQQQQQQLLAAAAAEQQLLLQQQQEEAAKASATKVSAPLKPVAAINPATFWKKAVATAAPVAQVNNTAPATQQEIFVEAVQPPQTMMPALNAEFDSLKFGMSNNSASLFSTPATSATASVDTTAANQALANQNFAQSASTTGTQATAPLPGYPQDPNAQYMGFNRYPPNYNYPYQYNPNYDMYAFQQQMMAQQQGAQSHRGGANAGKGANVDHRQNKDNTTQGNVVVTGAAASTSPSTVPNAQNPAHGQPYMNPYAMYNNTGYFYPQQYPNYRYYGAPGGAPVYYPPNQFPNGAPGFEDQANAAAGDHASQTQTHTQQPEQSTATGLEQQQNAFGNVNWNNGTAVTGDASKVGDKTAVNQPMLQPNQQPYAWSYPQQFYAPQGFDQQQQPQQRWPYAQQ